MKTAGAAIVALNRDMTSVGNFRPMPVSAIIGSPQIPLYIQVDFRYSMYVK
jgi:hypothetical protein